MSPRKPDDIAGVYVIHCHKSGKVYVGRSITIRHRWTSHRWHLARGSHRNHHLQRSWKKHGADNFEFRVERQIDMPPGAELEAALQRAEVEVLALYPKTYNLMEVGLPALQASQETRAKLSADRKARWADPEYRARVSASQKAKHAEPSFSKKRGAAISKGKSTPEARARMAESAASRWAAGGDLRETQGAKQKANWQDPAYRAQQSASRKASHADPESKARRSAALKAAWARRKAKADPTP